MAEEPTTEPAATAEPEPTTPKDEPGEVDLDAMKSALKKANDEAKKQRLAAKANADELERLKRDQMNDAEKAIAAVRDETRNEVTREFAGKLAGAEIRAAASGRVANVDKLLEGVDASKFLDADGEPDRAAIAEWIDGFAPKNEEPSDPFVDLGQGNRPSSRGDLALGSDELLQSVLKTINK